MRGKFDAAQNFNRSLSQARAARGEPDNELVRTLWKAKNQIQDNPGRSVGFALLGATLLGSVIYLIRRARPQVMSIEAQSADEWEAA